MKLETIPFTGSQDAVVVISFPHGGITDYWGFKSAFEGCPYSSKNLDGGATCAAVIDLVISRVMHPASMAAAIGVTSMNCSVNSSHVIIAGNCKRSASNVRKFCNAVCKYLRPADCFSNYSILIGRLYGTNDKGTKMKIRPDRESYNYCAKKLMAGLKNISIGLFGKVEKLSDEHLSKIEEAADSKINEKDVDNGKLRADYGVTIEPCCMYETLKFNDQYEAVMAQDYLMTILPIFEHVHDSQICVEESALKVLKNANKESKFAAFGKNFLKSRTDEGSERMIYYAASRALFTVEEAVKASKKGLTQNNIESVLKKAL